jgi:hypothetical protein
MVTGRSKASTSAKAPSLRASWSYFALVAVLLTVFYLWQGEMLLKFI